MGVACRTPRPWPSHIRIAIGEPRPNYWSLAEAKSQVLWKIWKVVPRRQKDMERSWKGTVNGHPLHPLQNMSPWEEYHRT
jgi:hypothetical protein